MRELRGPLGRLADLLDVRVDRLPVPVVLLTGQAGDLLAHERRVVEDDGEQVVEVVRDPPAS